MLNWMLAGLKMLQERGMRFPAGDQSALAKEIVEDSNRVISFLRDRCTYAPGSLTPSAELFEAYRAWCASNGYKALATNNFAKQLLAAGRYFGRPIDRERKRTGTSYLNLKLSTMPGGWEEE